MSGWFLLEKEKQRAQSIHFKQTRHKSPWRAEMFRQASIIFRRKKKMAAVHFTTDNTMRTLHSPQHGESYFSARCVPVLARRCYVRFED